MADSGAFVIPEHEETPQKNIDPDQTSDMSEPEIISSVNGSNGENSDSTSKSSVLVVPIPDLPQTVTYLEGPNGSQVYIVGTAHFSEESNQDVITTIETVKPHIICMELCKNRLHVIKCTDEEILDEVHNVGVNKMRELISRSGMFYGMFQFAFLHLSSGLTKQLGVAPGGEFRAAYRKGRELGCTFRLSDRSIQTTLRRAIYSLTVWKQFGLAIKLIFNNEKITQDDVESFKGDLLEKLIKEIAGEYPNLSRIFVDERDQYLSSKIHEAGGESARDICKRCSEAEHNSSSSSQASEDDETVKVPEKTRVVAIVGIGHISGIKRYWGQHIDLEAICRIPEPSVQMKVVTKSIKYGLLTLLLYTTYKTAMFGYYIISPILPVLSLTEHFGNVTSYVKQAFSPH